MLLFCLARIGHYFSNLCLFSSSSPVFVTLAGQSQPLRGMIFCPLLVEPALERRSRRRGAPCWRAASSQKSKRLPLFLVALTLLLASGSWLQPALCAPVRLLLLVVLSLLCLSYSVFFFSFFVPLLRPCLLYSFSFCLLFSSLAVEVVCCLPCFRHRVPLPYLYSGTSLFCLYLSSSLFPFVNTSCTSSFPFHRLPAAVCFLLCRRHSLFLRLLHLVSAAHHFALQVRHHNFRSLSPLVRLIRPPQRRRPVSFSVREAAPLVILST